MLGWGLAVNTTPMAASAITTGRWGGVSRWTVSTAWNATFTFFGLAAVVAGDRRDVHPSLTSRP
jgi:hypothetical protein